MLMPTFAAMSRVRSSSNPLSAINLYAASTSSRRRPSAGSTETETETGADTVGFFFFAFFLGAAAAFLAARPGVPFRCIINHLIEGDSRRRTAQFTLLNTTDA